uniref:PB1-like domain-containing protein n=1 Tax=Tanacetum cinerariifolium TaxID=118510 RepID=A0A699HD40_TANCI|nr:hypothetical protein [Tanacetum cinerariifolium]
MNLLTVTLHHDGVFVSNPLKCVLGSTMIINDTQFEEMPVSELFDVIDRLVVSPTKRLDYVVPGTTLTRGIREITSDDDMVEFVKVGLENGEVKTIVEDEGVVEIVVEQEKYPENIDFHTEGEENVVLEKFSIDDLFLTKRVGKGNYIGIIENPIPLLSGHVEEVDYEDAVIDPKSDGNRLQRDELLVVLRLQRDQLLHQTMHIQEYELIRDEEAARQVMQEEIEEEERRRLVGEEEHMEYKYNLDMEWGHFSNDENDRPGTISELHALEEAHVQHNADLPSVSHGSAYVQATVEFQSHPRPLDTTPTIMEAETEESQAPPLNPSQRKRHPITQRNKSERITKRRKLTFQGHGFGGSPSKPFSI